MRQDFIKFSSAVGAGSALILLYLVFIVRYSLVADWSNLSQIELWILVTQVLRLIILIALKRRYELQPLIPIILFSVESLLIPPLLALYVLTGTPAYALTMGTILTAWMGATAIVLSPYLSYSFAKSMTGNATLTGVIALSGLEFAYSAFMATVIGEATSPIIGLTGLGAYLVESLRTQISSVGIPLTNDIIISSASIIFFLSLLTYSTLGVHHTTEKINLPFAMILPLIATIIVLVWTSAVSSYDSDVFVTMTAPAVVLAIIVWGGAHGKG